MRKHCRKSHPEWLREVDLEKSSLGCRWAAYCTRQVIEEGQDDPRTTPVGSKRAREMIELGNAQYGGTFSTKTGPNGPSGLSKGTSFSSESKAFGDGGSLVPPRPHRQASNRSSDGMVVPPEVVAVPNDLSTPLPAETSKLTPNAAARQRLGEIADFDGAAASIPNPDRQGFFAWGMPPLKRGLSLADTRDVMPPSSGSSVNLHEPADDDSQAPPSRSESFLDSILAS